MQKAKEKVALGSIAASGGLTIAKAIVGVMTGSLAILSEAAHSLIDFAATVMTYFAVRVSGKPADDEHHYGHGKFESVAALAETALLFLLSGVVIYEAIRRLLGAGACRRSDHSGFCCHRRLDRDRFFPRPRLEQGRARDLERGARSRRAAFQLRSVVIARRSDRPRRRRTRIQMGRCRGRARGRDPRVCSPAGGSAAAPSTPCSTPRLPALPTRSPASRGACRAWSRSTASACGQVGPDQFVELNVSVSRTTADRPRGGDEASRHQGASAPSCPRRRSAWSPNRARSTTRPSWTA